MSELFGDLERLVTDLYPWRYLIGVGLLIVIAAIAAYGYREGWHNAIWRRRWAIAIVGTPVLAMVIISGWYLLSPLFERTRLEESSPLIATDGPVGNGAMIDGNTTADSTVANSVAANKVVGANSAVTMGITHSGEFMGADDFHFGRGQALLIQTSPGQYVLRFEDFSVRNGPGLYVYLSPEAGGYTDDSLEIGKLKATDGSFNYDVPAGTDVSQFKSVVVWCKPFGVLFAVAPLVEL